MKTEESLFLRSFLLRKKENSLFEGNLYERNKRFLIYIHMQCQRPDILKGHILHSRKSIITHFKICHN